MPVLLNPSGIATFPLLLFVSFLIVRILLPPSHRYFGLIGGRFVLPPGPKGSPLLGSLLPWLKARGSGRLVPWLQEQAQYGEMTTLNMGTRTWVERPYFPIAGGLVSRHHRLFLQKTEQWREGRRLLHQLMTGEGSKSHGSLVEEASLGLLKAESNLNFLDFHQQQLCGFWETMGDFHYRTFKHWWSELKDAHIPKSSFVRKTMQDEYGGSDDQAMYITLFIITAGSDNPRMTLNAFIMSCIACTEPLRRMQLELDSICGADACRLPDLNDLPNAPYTSAFVKEVLRWRPTVPLIPQRVLVEDLEFEGHKFPKGTEFLVNTIAVCTNGFDEADSFKPERWLGNQDEERDDTRSNSNIQQDLWQFAFSAGRRSCVGYKLAQKEMFVAFSRLAYCFDFAPAGNFSDKELNAFVTGPPFPVKITARSQGHERLIRNEAVKCGIWGSS